MLSKFYSCNLNDNNEMKTWDNFVENHPCCTPYHLSCWLKTVKDTYHFRDYLLMQKDRSGDCLSILPIFCVPKSLGMQKRYISIPFSDYGGPISRTDSCNDSIIENVFNELMHHGKSIEIRGKTIDKVPLKVFNYYKKHTLNLEPDLDIIKKNIDKKTILWSIRKAEKASVIIEVKNDYQALSDFYRLNFVTRKKHGVPAQPLRFFNNLFKYIIEPGRGYILTATYGGTVIAASVFIRAGDQLHYKYNASNPETLSRLCPNHLLMWNAITFAKEKGLKCIDLGRTSPDNKGLMRYKKMWGTDCSDVPYYFYPKISGVSSLREDSRFYSLINTLWSRFPDRLIELSSNLIFRYLA